MASAYFSLPQSAAMRPSDQARYYVRDVLRERGYVLADLSRRIGHKDQYLNQYIKQNTPEWLKQEEREALCRAVPELDEEKLKRPPVSVPTTPLPRRNGGAVTNHAGTENGPHIAHHLARASRIRALRTAQKPKLTQLQAAEAIGTSRAHLTKVELGQDPPSLEVLAAIATYYGVTLDYLEFGPEPQDPQITTEGFNREDKLAWLSLGADLGRDGRAALIDFIHNIILKDSGPESGGGSPARKHRS